MLIGELSKRTGFSHDTIRFYEKKGFIRVDKKQRRQNNYKEYSDEVLDKLLLIRMIKGLGFTLNETEEFIKGWTDEDASCANMIHHLTDKVTFVDKQIVALQAIKSKLMESLNGCQANQCEFEKRLVYLSCRLITILG